MSYIFRKRNKGLLKLVDDQIELCEGGEFFKDKEIWSLFKLNSEQFLVGTQYNGFYTYKGGKTTVWNTQANQFIFKAYFCLMDCN